MTATISESDLRVEQMNARRAQRGRYVAIAAGVWSVASLIAGVVLAITGNVERGDNVLGFWQIGLAVLGIVGAILLFLQPYRHKFGYWILMLWAIVIIPVMTTNLDNHAWNDQVFNLTLSLTDTLELGGTQVLYAVTGINFIGLIWIVLLNTVVVPAPLQHRAPSDDVLLPGPSS